MQLATALNFVRQDVFNIRVLMRSLAGIVTIAVATAISMLTNEFTHFANKSLDASIEPTRPVAGIVVALSKGEKLFSKDEFSKLSLKLEKLKESKLIVDYSPISIFNENSFPIRNHKGLNRRMLTVSYWGIPYCSPLFSEQFGLKVISGQKFVPKLSDGKELQGCDELELNINESNTNFLPRFGVIVNLKFLKKYLGIDDKALTEFRKDPTKLPTHIKMEFPPIAKKGGGFSALDMVDLEVSGYIDDAFYPDLMLSEDVLKSYFLAYDDKGGSFKPHYALHMLQHNTSKYLFPKSGLPANIDPGYYPSDYAMLNYARLSKDSLTPYNMVIVHANEWKKSGTREDIKSQLGEVATIKSLSTANTTQLLDAMTKLTTRADELDDFLDEDYSEVMANQRRSFMNLMKPLDINHDFDISAIASNDPTTQIFKLSLPSSLEEYEINISKGVASINVLPSWAVKVPGSKMTTALLKLKSIVDAYGLIMFWVVLMLASSASLLFAFSHILTKNRDISLFFTIGASKGDVFLIYMSQIIMIVLVGFVLGIGLSVLLSMGLEPSAKEMLANLFSTTNMSIEISEQSIFEMNLTVLIQSFNWVFWAAAIGAILPVAKATKTDPLSNQSKGM